MAMATAATAPKWNLAPRWYKETDSSNTQNRKTMFIKSLALTVFIAALTSSSPLLADSLEEIPN